MAKKDLIIGAYNRLTIQDLKPWLLSIKESGFKGDVVLIASNVPDFDINDVKQTAPEVQVLSVRTENTMLIHMVRFFYIYDFLKKNKDQYRFVVSTDVRDVVFQKNPIEWLEERDSVKRIDIVAQSESLKIKDEEWNRDNIKTNFGDYFYQDISENEIYNVGILAGRSEWICDLCFHIYQYSLNRKDWVADQAAYNMLLSFEPWKSHTQYVNLSNAWALNAHVTHKPEVCDKLKPFMLEETPYMKDGIVYNSDGKPFYIIHQYDREPSWRDFYLKKYGVDYTQKNPQFIVIDTNA